MSATCLRWRWGVPTFYRVRGSSDSEVGCLLTAPFRFDHPGAILHYKMRIALGAPLGMVPPPKVYLHLEMCCGCITTSSRGREVRLGEHLPIYLTRIYVSIQGDGRGEEEREWEGR